MLGKHVGQELTLRGDNRRYIWESSNQMVAFECLMLEAHSRETYKDSELFRNIYGQDISLLHIHVAQI